MYGRQSSRRFACDRCRTYKLRCERHPISGAGNGCERCVKARLICKTTTPTNKTAARAPASTSHHGTESEPWGGDRSQTAGPIHTPLRQSLPRPPSANCQHTTVPRSNSPNTLSDTSTEQGFVNPMHLIWPTVSPPQRSLHPAADKQNDGADMDHCDMRGPELMGLEADQDKVNTTDFMMVDFSCNDNSSGATTSPDQQDNMAMAGSTGRTDVFNLSSQSHVLDDMQSPLKDSMNFCAALIEEYHSFKHAHRDPPHDCSSKLIERSIQTALDHTSRLLKILENLTVAEAPSHRRQISRQNTDDGSSSPASAFDGGISSNLPARSQQSQETLMQGSMPTTHAAHAGSGCNDSISSISSKHESCDVLLMTTLVTSYVYLIRIWRSVFSLLHRHLLLPTTPGHTRLLLLPSLQLGGFRILNSPSIQIRVLFELRTDLFQRIEGILGIGSAGAYGRYGEDREQKGQVLCVNPFAGLIRETLLHQEQMRAATEDGTGDLSLKDITTKVKRLLDSQG
ncbi:hypothetical protein N7447_004561 [Penicillium robsamsonii]|uniref:uncharacterized protein n=1 Tax=Penicillium robsamsonii TaxID=1792511 RepID=UPI002549411C|nr:uncharacterized protein N7447_004561 [Penicillium robsamsonii]KAJ5827798.1 hypothetical protein N7447_004561 [Penicillium robsamsonii]